MAANDVNIRIKAIDDTKRAFNSVRGSLSGLKNAVFSVQGALSALAGGAIVKGIVDTNVEFQNLEASLKTFTGSAENARKEFDALSAFAASTPYELQDVVSAFNILVARGIKPSEEALTAFGNIASGTGKSLNQFIEAVADAATGEFERLKEFGIKANKEGDNIKFTFGGVTTNIKNNSEAIKGYLQELGNTKFAGAMEEQSKTLGGAFSNLKDAIATTAKIIGESGLNDFIIEITRSLTDLINKVNIAIKGKGVFGAINELLFGTNQEQALEQAQQNLASWQTTLSDAVKDGVVKDLPLIQQEVDKAFADVKRAFADLDRTTQQTEFSVSKIGDTIDDVTGSADSQTAPLKQLATITEDYGRTVATVWSGQGIGKRLTMDEYVNVLLSKQKDLLPEVVSSIGVYEESVKTLGDSLRDVGDNAIRSVEDGLVDLISGAKSASDAFRDMASSIIKDLIRMYIQSTITTPIAQALGIGSFGSQSAAPIAAANVNLPGKAIGGSVQSGRNYMVGERGPELFVPNQSGAIVPNNKLGGGGVVVNQTINVSTGVQQTVRAEVMSLMPQIAGAAKAAVADAKLRGGSYAAALR
jgi:hypothetical protein